VGVDAATFRAVLGQWPSGVTVVTTVRPEAGADGTVSDVWHGMTASSFSSVSLDPPLVSVCLDKNVWTHDLIESAGVFAVNILAKDQAHVGKRFAGMLGGEPTTRFDGLDTQTHRTGSPVLADALGWVDCRVCYAYPGGDHTIFVGEVLAAAAPRTMSPLLFHSRAWGQFADQLPEAASVVDSGTAAALRARGVDPDTVTATLTALREAGVATRVADLTAGDRLEPVPSAAAPGWARVATVADVAACVSARVEGVDVAPGPEQREVVRAAQQAGLQVRVEVPAAFDPVRQDATLQLLDAAVATGADAVVLVDDGTATPLTVRAVLQDAVPRARPVQVGVRLSDRTGLGAAHALTALKSGVRMLDATLGGLSDAVAVEDALHLLDQLEVTVPADRDAVVRAAIGIEATLGAELPGRTYRLSVPASPGGTP
jgi:flavin reductase (DIM6/NTAB) family NADH-FMN oxidoreductase RutF